VNVIISVPGLYGYAAVIFNHPVFAPYMNALSKLVIFSSLVHQLSFVLFSSMSFAIGTVQDAGLIFLSSMANTIANQMISDGESDKAIVSTTMVLLSAGTSLLGVILIIIGRFKLANIVSYLPMPVVGGTFLRGMNVSRNLGAHDHGVYPLLTFCTAVLVVIMFKPTGYLAFIGYFCVQAGVALCISQPLITFSDWAYLFSMESLGLAIPGLLAGLLLTWISRTATNDIILPLFMVGIPALFYAIVYGTGAGLEGARKGHWVGDAAPPTPVSDLFQLVDFSLVRWDLVGEILWTWVGMVFVVSFASCLDVAAISMDKGEALDTNRELATVGMGNCESILCLLDSSTLPCHA
jgi:sulfate permease, SulP family